MSVRPCLIVAIDLNEHAKELLQRASKLANFSDATLVAVHVVEHETGFESDHAPFLTPTQLRSAMARDARAWMVGLLHHLGIANAQVIVRSGKLAEELAQVVEEYKARYIVTGQLKWGALGKLATLSKDHRVVNRCDVLTVGSTERRLGRVVSDWVNGLLPGADRGPRY